MNKAFAMFPLSGKKGYRQSAGSRQFRKKRKPRQKASRMPRKVKGLTRQVRELRRLANSDMGVHVHRFRRTGRVLAEPNEQGHKQETACGLTKIEKVLEELLYYNPSDPANLIKSDGGLGTYHRDYFFTGVKSRIVCRNNYRVPVRLSLFRVMPKVDTSINPDVAFVSGLVDVGNVSDLSPLAYLTDSQLFNDLWRINSAKKIVLQPGQQCILMWYAKPFQYDPSLSDQHTFTFQPVFQAMAWEMFVNGVVSHDIIDGAQEGTIACGIDYMVDTTFVVKYPAGVDLRQFTIDDTADVMTTQAIVSNKPEAVNQGYSAS